ncbi:hypothetical protein, conserved [Eimeria brunetti]|uniref:Uncharacterized protein n=1 Tax=Eimeria brunetti TaxID=51314 RepID=U6LKV5_9EIME|nr:hypothetical protein, conserved [Eimeria brunetti]
MSGSGAGGGGSSPAPDPSIAESIQRAQAIAASLARSKGGLSTPSVPPAPVGPPTSTSSSGFSHRPPSASASRGSHISPRGPSNFDYGGPHDSGFSQGPTPGSRGGLHHVSPRGSSSYDQGGSHGAADKQPPHILPVPGRSEGSWNSVDAAAAIAAQQKQLLQQRARKAAVRAMATVCAAIPKPDLRDPDLLGADIKKTARQLENGVWILDLPLQTGVCGVTAASPDAWQQLQHVEVIASLRRRTGAGFVLRGSPLQQQQQVQQQQQMFQGVYVRVVGEDQETLYRGAVAAWSSLGSPQYLPAPVDAADDETFDCATAMAGEDDEFLKDVCQRTGALIDIEPDQPQGYAHGGAERGGLRYAARACTQGAAEKALRLLRWRLVCIEEAWRQHNAHGFARDNSPTGHRGGWRESPYGPSPGQDIRGAAAASFWQSAMPDEAEMMRRRKEAEERRKKRGQRSRSASPERRGPNRLSFAPPPDELLTGPYAPLDK